MQFSRSWEAGSPRWSAYAPGSGVGMVHVAFRQGVPKSLPDILNTELNFDFFCLLTIATDFLSAHTPYPSTPQACLWLPPDEGKRRSKVKAVPPLPASLRRAHWVLAKP